MELSTAVPCFAGIADTQVGHPLPDCLERFTHGISPDRLTGAARPASVTEAEDEEVGELGLVTVDKSEGRVVAVVVAEEHPLGEMGVLGEAGLDCGGGSGRFERSAEISAEASSVGRTASRQGRGCGYRWLK